MRFARSLQILAIIHLGFGCALGLGSQEPSTCIPSNINVALVLRAPGSESSAMMLVNDALSELGYSVFENGYRSPSFDCFVRVNRVDSTHISFIRYYREGDSEKWMRTLRAVLERLIEDRGLTQQVSVAETILLQD